MSTSEISSFYFSHGHQCYNYRIAFLALLLNTPKELPYNRNTTYKRYNPNLSQMKIDLWLLYRKFKKLYPNNHITYDEYKNLQIQFSFKHSISSQQNYGWYDKYKKYPSLCYYTVKS